MRIQFGSYRLDDQRFILERDGVRVSMRPKVFDLLAYLVRDSDRVVPREELVDALWGGAVVGMGSLSGLVNELRKLLREEGRGPSSIRTVHARGYQFVAKLESVEEEAPSGTQRASLPSNFGDGPGGSIPDLLPAPIERALWLHLREDVQRIEKVKAWLDQLRSEAAASDRGQMKWKRGLEEDARPIRTMRTVEGAASLSPSNTATTSPSKSTSRAEGAASGRPLRGGESSRSA